MLKLNEIGLKLEKIITESSDIKSKLEADIKLFDEEINNQKKLMNEKIKKINENRTKRIKSTESRINELEKEKTFLAGCLSISKLNNEISQEDFDGLMQKLKK